MVNNIPEIFKSRKASNVALVLIMVLLGILSFGLGRLSTTGNDAPPILKCPGTVLMANTTDTGTQSINTIVETGQYVVSRNGTKYYYPWCSGAQRIKEENKVYYNTKEEAEQAGYTPASNCKGL